MQSGPGIQSPSHWERRGAVAVGGAGEEEPLRGFNRDLRLAERRRSSSGDGVAAKTPPAITAIGGVVLDDVDGYTNTHKHTQAHTKRTQTHAHIYGRGCTLVNTRIQATCSTPPRTAFLARRRCRARSV